MSFTGRKQKRVTCILVVCLLFFALTTYPFTTVPTSPSKGQTIFQHTNLFSKESSGLPSYNEFFESNSTNNFEDLTVAEKPPIPKMPSDLFQKMALSQLEVLANSLTIPGTVSESKVESMALYLPQENINTGQLEFTPVVLFPDPTSEVRNAPRIILRFFLFLFYFLK